MNTTSTLSELQKLPQNPVAPENALEFCVMGVNGDTKYIWDKSKTVEVKRAEDTFKGFKKDGYMAYKVIEKDGSKGEVLNEFDPNAGAIIFSPAMQGG